MNSMKANIAVVLATYNGEKFLCELLDSVLSQTLMPKEIIIQDDNSNDCTWSILTKYKNKYPHLIHLYKNECNLGAHNNFLKAFQYVTADYIAPCDQDDIWMPEKLERSYTALKKGQYSLVACKEHIYYEDGRMIPHNYPMPPLEDIILGHSVAGHLMIVPRSALNVLKIPKRVTYDFGFTLYAACNYGGSVIDYYGCIWRRHSAVVTTEYSNHNPSQFEYISKWQKLFKVLKLTMRGEHSMVIANRENAIHQIIAHFSRSKQELRVYDKLAINMMKQTPISLLRAGLILSKIKSRTIEYRNYSLRSKIANRLFNLCQPYVYWYDYHLRDAL